MKDIRIIPSSQRIVGAPRVRCRDCGHVGEENADHDCASALALAGGKAKPKAGDVWRFHEPKGAPLDYEVVEVDEYGAKFRSLKFGGRSGVSRYQQFPLVEHWTFVRSAKVTIVKGPHGKDCYEVQVSDGVALIPVDHRKALSSLNGKRLEEIAHRIEQMTLDEIPMLWNGGEDVDYRETFGEVKALADEALKLLEKPLPTMPMRAEIIENAYEGDQIVEWHGATMIEWVCIARGTPGAWVIASYCRHGGELMLSPATDNTPERWKR